MATNPKKSHRREKMRLQSERVQSQLDILSDCLSDIFDKYSILSYTNADTNTNIYWTYQRVKEYQPARYNNSVTYRPLSGIAIKNLSRSYSFDEDSEKYNPNHNMYNDISSGGGGAIAIVRNSGDGEACSGGGGGGVKKLMKEMTGCDIEIRHDYHELLILLR